MIANVSKGNQEIQPILSHISINPDSKNSDDKLIYYYKYGGEPESYLIKLQETFGEKDIPDTNSDKINIQDVEPLNINGLKKTTTPLDNNHPALKGKIYVEGERVEYTDFPDKVYHVISHINPVPTETGEPDWNKMLVKDKEGKLISVDRHKVQLKGPDLTKVQKVKLADGSEKPYHQLKEGDMIVKDGKKHEVFNIDPDGIWTHSEDLSSGSRLHFQHVSDWDKPFKHLEFDKHKRAEVHDIISYEDEMGRSKKSKVTGVTDEGAIVETTKRGELIIIKHGDYEFTGKRYNVIKIKEEKPKERSRFIPQEVKDTVWRRAKGKCEICGSQVDLEFDHIIPFSKGGSNTYRNIQLLCVKCNREKSDSIG